MMKLAKEIMADIRGLIAFDIAYNGNACDAEIESLIAAKLESVKEAIEYCQDAVVRDFGKSESEWGEAADRALSDIYLKTKDILTLFKETE